MVETLYSLEKLIQEYGALLSISTNPKEIELIQTLLEDCRRRYHSVYNSKYKKKSVLEEFDYDANAGIH
jgi:hypothetical protein